MKKNYKLVYKENEKQVVLTSNDAEALLVVLHQKVSAHVAQYRSSNGFELISYGETSEKK